MISIGKTNRILIFSSIIILLIVLLTIICVNNKSNTTTHSKTKKNNKETFQDNIININFDDSIDKIPTINEVIEYTDNLKNKVEEIINNKITEYNKKLSSTYGNTNNSSKLLDTLPIGTILIWHNDTLPLDENGVESIKWAWCDGQNISNYLTPNLNLRYPIGGKGGTNHTNNTELSANDKPKDNNTGKIDKDSIFLLDSNCKIYKNYIPDHKHKIGNNFPDLSHAHTTSSSGNHNHGDDRNDWGYVGNYHFRCGGMSRYFDADNVFFKGGGWNSTTNSIGHTHTTPYALENTHNEQINNNTNILTKWPDNPTSDCTLGDEDLVFYPKSTITNFIIKIKD